MIRKSFVLIAVLSLSAAPLQGQGLEFSGGVNFAKLSGDAVSAAARNIGMNFGIDLVIPIGPVGLNLGADWAQKGSELTELAETSLVDLTYIEVPLHVRLPLVGAGPIRLNVVLGPTLGINTGCEITTDLGGLQKCEDVGLGAIDPRSLDWSGTGGLGVSLRLGGLAYAGVDLKYTLGLTEVEDTALNDSLKNRAFTLQGHFGFDVF